MESIDLTKIIITAVITAVCIGFIGGGIGYLFYKLRKTDEYITKTDCEKAQASCVGKQFADTFKTELGTLRKEFREDIKSLRDVIVTHITKGSQ
jgi:hypothetical protein